MAQAAQIIARWATLLSTESALPNDEAHEETQAPALNFSAEAQSWAEVANDFTVKTLLMWRDGWFRDYDSSVGEWSTQQDAMHLAPVFCEVAGQGHIEHLREKLAQPPAHSSGWAPLSWPPVVMTLVGAADAARMPLDAAELAYRYIDASYRSTDRHELDEQGGLPGVTREYRQTITVGKWGKTDYANSGIEGYGWGALSVHLLLRYLLGLREEEVGKITIAPVLPQALRRTGETYHVEPVPWGRYILRIECTVKDAQRYRLRLWCVVAAAGESLENAQKRVMQQEVEEHECEWEAEWGEGHTLQLPQLTIASV